MKTIKAYRVTCTEAYMMDEQGTGYSFSPWGQDTDRYKGYDEEVEVLIPDDAIVEDGLMPGCPLLFLAGAKMGMDLPEALAVGAAKLA